MITIARHCGIALLGLFLLGISGALAKDEHPIDRALVECVAQNTTTAGMTNCTYDAFEQWQALLEENLAKAKKAAKDPSRIEAEQERWLKQRDAEFKRIDEKYAKLEGTMYIPIRVHDRLDVIKSRALELAAKTASKS